MRYQLFIALLVLSLLSSCVNSRHATYFEDLDDSASFDPAKVPETVIQQSDLLSITVYSPNPEASLIFNLPNRSEIRSSTPTGDVMEPAGYLVHNDGTIRFLMLGAIQAEGLTKEQLSEKIRLALIERNLLLEPVVEVRYLNFRVTVVGEVARPTVVTVPNEKITLLEALGLAGDITIFGKKDDVMVIREVDGKTVVKHLDLNSAELFSSPYYYLKSGDIVYVEPSRARILSGSRLFQLLPPLVSSLSVLVIILDRLAR